MSRTWGGAAGLAAALAGAACAGVAPARAAAEAQTVELKVVELKQDRSMRGFGLDEKGGFEMPFANAAGKLRFEFKGGKLRADSNGDGAIDAKDAPAVKAGTAIRVDARMGGQSFAYPIFVAQTVNAGKGQGYLVLSSRAALEGTLDGRTVRLLDGDLDGRFGGDSDTILFAGAQKDDAAEQPQQWSRVVEREGGLVELGLVDGGRQLKLTPYTGAVAEVKLDAGAMAKAQVTLSEVSHAQTGPVTAERSARFVPGKYRLASVMLHPVAGAAAQDAMLYGYDGGDGTPLELKAGANVVKLGAPFAMKFAAVKDGDKVVVTEASVTGCAGESYRPYCSGDEAKDGALSAYVRAGGQERKLTKLEFG